MDEVTTRPRGRPKGSKDTIKRVRGVSKAHIPKEAYEYIKEYLRHEKDYNKTKMLRDSLPKYSRKRKWFNNHMRAIRDVQADLYLKIANNHLAHKLASELGIGRTIPYRRYLYCKQRKEKKGGKQI